MGKNIYITWHLATHGVGYTKNIAAAFFRGSCSVGKDIDIKVNQLEMEAVFETDSDGFLFDKIYYLHTEQHILDKVSTFRLQGRKEALKRDDLIKGAGTEKSWKDIFENGKENFADEITHLSQEFPKRQDEVINQYWRFINYYTIKDQLTWLTTYSNFSKYAENRFETINMTKKGVKDLRDYIQIANAVHEFVQELKKTHPDARFTFNISLGSYETQVVWFCLAEAGLLPLNTQFIASYDDKSNTLINKRFRDFYIKTRPTTIISTIRSKFSVYEKPKSNLRKLANLKIQNYIKAGFSILLIGERGTGKTRLVKENSGAIIIAANCASFDDDSKAEAELFGTVKSAYTNAIDKDGLFQKAHGDILFLDEIHHLSKDVQAKLMRALGTDKENNFTVRKMGDTKETKVKFTFIAATNKTIEELKTHLLPDFFDRIAQLVVELPSLRATPKDRIDDWRTVWEELNFESSPPLPVELELIEWLKDLKLYGNFRDLQKIAIYYNRFLTFSKDLKKLLAQTTPVAYAKAEFKKYHQTNNSIVYQFSRSQKPREAIAEFHAQFAEWAISEFGSMDKAEKHFEKIGDKVTKGTLSNWKNKKSHKK